MNPVVFVVAGPAGSGKSTLGRALAAHWDAVLLDQDILTNPLMAQIARMAGASAHDLDHPALAAPAVRAARYQCLLDTALSNVEIGRSVVLVAPFTAEIRHPDAWATAFGSFVPAPVLLWVTVPPEVAAQRRRARALPRDLAAALDMPAPAAPGVPHVFLDGTLPVRDTVDLLAQRFSE